MIGDLENKEVPCKTFQDKELRGRFERKLLRIIVRRKGEIICKAGNRE
jgi:hypothetical protein